MAHGGGCHRLPGFAHFESSLNTVSSPLCSFEQLDLRFGPEDVGLPNTGLDLSCVNGLDLSSASYEGLNLSQQCLNLSNSGTRGSQSSQNSQKQQQQQQQNGTFANQPGMVLNLSTQIGLNLTRPNVMGYPILEQGISETFDTTGQEGSGFGYYGDYSNYPSYPTATSTLCQMEEQRCSPLNLERRSSPLNLAVVPGVSGARKRKPTPGQAQPATAGKLMHTQANYNQQQDFTCNNQVYDYRIPNKLTAFYNQQSNEEVKRQVADIKQEGQKEQGMSYQADIEVELAQHGGNELFFSDLQFQQESVALQGNTFASDLNLGLQSGGKGQGVEYNNRKEEKSQKKLEPRQQEVGGKGKQGVGKQLHENTNESNPAHATFPFSDASYPDLNYSYTDALNFAAEALDANNSTSTSKSFSSDFSHTVVTSVKNVSLQKTGAPQNETVSCLNKVRFVCSSCSLEFSSSADMNKHMDGHNKALNAVEQSRSRPSHDHRKDQAVSKSSEVDPQCRISIQQNYNCSLCKMDFVEESQLLSHNKMQHEGTKERQNNSIVKQNRGGSQSYSRDLDISNKNCRPTNLTKKEVAQEKSGRGLPHSVKYEVKTKSQEEIQKLKEEMSREPFPYQCVTCSKKFAERSELLQHMEDHNAMKPFKCDICALGFTYMSAKKRHEKTHSNDKPFQCKECMRTFHRKSDLTTHSKTHNKNKRRHSCEQCGQMFPTENQVKEHNCSARPSKQLKCEVCPSVLATKVEWGVHMWRHTKNSSYILTSEDDPLPRIGCRRLAETSCLPASDETPQPLNLNMQVLQA